MKLVPRKPSYFLQVRTEAGIGSIPSHMGDFNCFLCIQSSRVSSSRPVWPGIQPQLLEAPLLAFALWRLPPTHLKAQVRRRGADRSSQVTPWHKLSLASVMVTKPRILEGHEEEQGIGTEVGRQTRNREYGGSEVPTGP